MGVGNYSRDLSSQPKFDVSGMEVTPQVTNNREVVSSQAVLPAKLPLHSQAAVAQRLNDVPEKPASGLMYSAPHLRVHPVGWRTKRYAKRKKLRLNFMHAATMDRKSTLTLRRLALGMLTLIVISSIAFATVVSFIGATQQRFGDDVVRFEDMLPGDSLRLYDMHGQLIYEATDQGLQISVPLSQISLNMKNAQVAIEDQNFWKNPGYDITGIIRAAMDDLTSGRVVSGGARLPNN